MAVVCGICGKISEDAEFCDHCNVDLKPPDDRRLPDRCPVTDAGIPVTARHRILLARVGDGAEFREGSHAWRVHWIPRDKLPEWQPLINERLAHTLDVLPPARLVEERRGTWLIADAASKRSTPWLETIPDDPLARIDRLASYVEALARGLEELHGHGLLWLNFDPGAIEESATLVDWGNSAPRELRFTNLDVRLFHFGECPESVRLHGKFEAPETCAFRGDDIGPATDVYHLALFTYYWLAGLLPQGFEGVGLAAFRHKIPPLRTFATRLPEGITPVVMRGLALEPGQRFATPRAFAGALRAARKSAQERRQFVGTLRWDAAGLSDAGRSKRALHRDNEDQTLVREFDDPPRLLTAVADGISTCDVGSGALASLIATMGLENLFNAGSSHDDFPLKMKAACELGARRLVDWALEKGYREQLTLGLDLMGTTLTAGWLEGRELSVANLGDSRAYLVTEHWFEQLTVDNDLASDMLKNGAAPEQVRDLGSMGRALRACVGGCMIKGGAIDILEESRHPSLSRWPIVPGDIILLCTDGLIDEGFFLEPETVVQIIQTHRHLPASDIARLLVDAADLVQRLPSEIEPEGFGDNISCIVIKIEG